jgi:hypothetical protein
MLVGIFNSIVCDGGDLGTGAIEQLWILSQMLEPTLEATTVEQDVVGRMGKELA